MCSGIAGSRAAIYALLPRPQDALACLCPPSLLVYLLQTLQGRATPCARMRDQTPNPPPPHAEVRDSSALRYSVSIPAAGGGASPGSRLFQRSLSTRMSPAVRGLSPGRAPSRARRAERRYAPRLRKYTSQHDRSPGPSTSPSVSARKTRNDCSIVSSSSERSMNVRLAFILLRFDQRGIDNGTRPHSRQKASPIRATRPVFREAPGMCCDASGSAPMPGSAHGSSSPPPRRRVAMVHTLTSRRPQGGGLPEAFTRRPRRERNGGLLPNILTCSQSWCKRSGPVPRSYTKVATCSVGSRHER